MTLFGRTGGYYLFWTGAIYLLVGLSLAFSEYRSYTSIVASIWVLVLMLPFIIPPLGRWLNMSVDWDKNMFDFFRRRTAKDYLDEASNVYKLPPPRVVPPLPEVATPAKDKAAYQIGKTESGKVTLSVTHDYGSTTLTMNNEGVDTLIRMLESAKD